MLFMQFCNEGEIFDKKIRQADDDLKNYEILAFFLFSLDEKTADISGISVP